MAPRVSFCVVNTNGRKLLLRCLESIFKHAPSGEFEVLVLDNASEDGSGPAVRQAYGERVVLVEHARRRGKAENDSELMERAAAPYCLLLNEDCELTHGAAEALLSTLEQDPRAGAAGGRVLDSAGRQQPSAWRFPGVATALAGLFGLHRRLVVQSTGKATRSVDWVQSAGMLVRRAAFEQVGPLDPQFFVYSDEVDWQRRARALGWPILYVPAARIVHGEQLSHGSAARRRIVEFSRNRDLYVRKHHGPVIAATVRLLTSATYLFRALAALLLPGHSPRRYLAHAYYSLFPRRGESLREAAETHNRTIKRSDQAGA
jgi:N-acetylglucosaminyl-diphospho-decaprenol L-rhamnosyltransferase